MNTSNFNWGDDIIDSRDIIARYDELNGELEDIMSLIEDAEEELNDFIKENGTDDYDEDTQAEFDKLNEALEEANDNLNDFNSSFEKDELDTLKEIIDQGEDSPDWNHGETLIHEDHFTTYTEELVNDCYDMPKELNEGKWPFNHMSIHWEGAAEELKNDYFDITVDGETYYIRA